MLATIGTGARGTAVHKVLKAAPYGWPQDAVDAVLIALHRTGHLRATRNDQAVATGALDQAGIKAAEFRPEKVRLTTGQRIALRGLFGKVGVNTKSAEEESRAPGFLGALEELADRAGGQAPLPPAPNTATIDDLKRLAGPEQLAEIHARRDELEHWIAAGPGSGAKVLNHPVPPAFRESVKVGEQNLYARAKELIGDRDPAEPSPALI